MKTLLILRHAKSSWAEPGCADHDRPLNARGKRDAPVMARLLVEHDLQPGHVLCSGARRARDTCRRVVEAVDLDAPITVTDDLYHAGPDEMARVIAGAPQAAQPLLVIGHNPGVELLVEALTGEPVTMPTAAIACIELPIEDWSSIGLAFCADEADRRGRLLHHWIPRDQ